MSKPKKCPKCNTKSLKEVDEGFSGTTWYVGYKCGECDHYVLKGCSICKPDPLWKTEYSIMSTPSTPIGFKGFKWQ